MAQEQEANRYVGGYGMAQGLRNTALYLALFSSLMLGCGKPTTYEAKVKGDITGRQIDNKNTSVKMTIDEVLKGSNESGLKHGDQITIDYPTLNLKVGVLESLKKCGKLEYWVFGDRYRCKGEASFIGVDGKKTEKYEGKDIVVIVYSPPKKPNETLGAIKRGASDIVKNVYEKWQGALGEGGKKWEEIDNEYQLKETFQALSRKGEKAFEDGMQELKTFEEKHQIGKRAREKAEKAQEKIGELTDDAKKEFKELLRRLRE